MNFISKKESNLDRKHKEYIEYVRKTIKECMCEELYDHSIGTYSYALMLAEKYLSDDFKNVEGYHYFKISIASLLHDYGKIYNFEELKKIAVDAKLKISRFERNCSQILHSFAAPYLIKRDFQINDKTINHAVKSHTTGSCKMNLIDKILYIADKVEETRCYEGIENLRKL